MDKLDKCIKCTYCQLFGFLNIKLKKIFSIKNNTCGGLLTLNITFTYIVINLNGENFTFA